MLIQPYEETIARNSIQWLLPFDTFSEAAGQSSRCLEPWMSEPEVSVEQHVPIILSSGNTSSIDEIKANLLTLLLQTLQDNYLSEVVLP